MSDQKNLLIAVVLCIAIVLGWQFFFPAPVPEKAETQQTTEATTNAAPTPDVAGGNATAPSAGAATAAPKQALSRDEVLAKAPRVKINTPNLHGSISLKGGRIDDVTLVQYKTEVDPTSPEIVLFAPAGSPNPYFADFGWSAAEGAGIKLPTNDTIWAASSNEITPSKPLVLTWDNGDGLLFKRTITVDEHFLFTVEQTIQNNTGKDLTLFPYGLISRTGTPHTSGFYILHEGPIGVLDETLEEVDYSDLKEGNSRQITSKGGWIGITDKFWLAALLPDQNATLKTRFSYLENADRFQTDYLNQTGVTIAAGSAATTTNHLFAGAKEVHLIDKYEADLKVDRLELAIDWGWFYIITKPLYTVLETVAKYVGNMGIAILIVTIMIKLILLPLAHKSYVSMSKMKKLQPEMVKLRERFADDRQKLNEEMMALYRKEKANPAAGCLPMIIQIPIFFALYKVLYVTLLMRHEPFYGWILDLSAPDPTSVFNLFGLIPWDPPHMLMIGVLPLLMGISMFLQQKFNPQPADPVQAKIFMFMPIFFTALLASFPAGLVIYWTWNNILSIAQQWFIMRRMGVSVNS